MSQTKIEANRKASLGDRVNGATSTSEIWGYASPAGPQSVSPSLKRSTSTEVGAGAIRTMPLCGSRVPRWLNLCVTLSEGRDTQSATRIILTGLRRELVGSDCVAI